MLVVDPEIVAAVVTHRPDDIESAPLRLGMSDFSLALQLVLLFHDRIRHFDQIPGLLHLLDEHLRALAPDPETRHRQQSSSGHDDHDAESSSQTHLRALAAVALSIFQLLDNLTSSHLISD